MISAALVRELREETGLPMMECKKALEETGGDKPAAVDLLRKKGLAQVGKRADRTTSEGRVLYQADPATGRHAMVAVLCETEPVTGTDEFNNLAQAAIQAAVKMDDPTAEAILAQPAPGGHKINDLLLDAVNRIRENIRLGQVACYRGEVGSYLHHDRKKGVLVEFSGPCPAEIKADVCMHIVSMRPPYVRREDVDPALLEQEKAVAAEQVKDKPANMIEKIVMGKVNRWYSEICLLEQPFVKDDKKSVGQLLREVSPGLTVNRFVRFEIGGG